MLEVLAIWRGTKKPAGGAGLGGCSVRFY